MLDKRTLARINARPRGRGPAVYVALGAVAVAVAAGLLVSYVVGAALLLAGGALASLLHRRDAEARTTRLVYDLDVERSARLAAVREACEALAGAEEVWRVEGEGARGATVPSAEVFEFGGNGASRRAVEVGALETPGISANVEVWGIKTGTASLFFLPEGTLFYKDDLYRAVSYEALGVTYRPSRVAEEPAAVPGDAEVIGETWRYTGADGGPDPRRADNPRYVVVLYGLLSISGTEPGGMRLLVSDKAAAVRFSRAFGAGKDGEQDTGGTTQSAQEEKVRRLAEAEAERLGSLLKVLGMAPGASRKEIDGAYKKKAKMYHPDRVANMDREVREMAELRMKEINAAYAELKRKNR